MIRKPAPDASSSPSPNSPPTLASVPPRHPAVLLVEDDPAPVAQYTRALSSDGQIEVIHVPTGEEAVEHLNRLNSIQCVVCAVELPEMDGFEVLRACKVVRPLTPVLLIANVSKPEYPSRAIHDHADDMLIAPVEDDVLKERVDRLIANGRAARSARARTVLAVGAHPDDVEIGAGGTLLRHAAAGDRIVHLLMTDGEVGGDKGDRIAEAEQAAEMLGMTLIRGKLPDSFLSDARETVSAVERAIAACQPSIVYVHSRHDGHQDHRATFHATMSAARGVHNHCCYQSPSSTVAFHPDRFVDVGDNLDSKIELINVYRSQTATRLYLAEDLIRATARYWGRHARHRLVEPFETVWQLTA